METGQVTTAAAVFDLDGTLVDSAGDIAEAVNRTLDGLALPRVAEATVRGWIGDGVGNLVATALRHSGSGQPAAAVMPVFMQHYHACLLRSPRLYDGVMDTLQALQSRGMPMAICTNKPSALVPPLLHTAALLGQAVDQCLMVGDSATDLQAANNAGMPIVLVRYGYPRDLDLDAAAAKAVVDDLRELLGHIG